MNAVLQQYICKPNAYTIYDPEGMALLGQGSQEHFFYYYSNDANQRANCSYYFVITVFFGKVFMEVLLFIVVSLSYFVLLISLSLAFLCNVLYQYTWQKY